MLAFIIPLKSSRASSDWALVCRLLERTLKSICHQTSNQFRVVVVCNETPKLNFQHPQVEYVSVDLEIPTTLSEKERDKARRMWTGLRFVQASNPSHVMFVDADDCISQHLVQFVNDHRQEDGWYVSKGYEYPEQTGIIYPRKKNLQNKTNTSHILKYDLLEPFISLDFEQVDDKFMYHQHLCNLMREMNHPLRPLPFAGVVYVTDNGENMYMQRKVLFKEKGVFKTPKQVFYAYAGIIYRFLIARPITSEIRHEFGLYEIGAPE